MTYCNTKEGVEKEAAGKPREAGSKAETLAASN